MQEDLQLPYYATGDILRAAVRDETELGKTAKQYMDRGDLVPDDVIVGAIAERIDSAEAADGFILDGFPRTVPQAEALAAKLAALCRELTAALRIDAAEKEVVRRLGGRRTCAEGGYIYHVEFNPPERGRGLRRRRQRADRPRRRQARGDPPPPRAPTTRRPSPWSTITTTGASCAESMAAPLRPRSPTSSAAPLATLKMEADDV